MYEKITADNPYETPMMIYPAIHYTMGGLWVDYNLMSTIPGLFVLGEANFSDHGANRLGASALMQGLADGYFVHCPTPSAATWPAPTADRHRPDTKAFRDRKSRSQASKTAVHQRQADRGRFPRQLGLIMWEYCGMARNEGLEQGPRR
jgi:succinate dehydrogenase / fumarate reductase flavoprotein subunit